MKKEYRIDIINGWGERMESHFTNHLMDMRERLLHQYGMKQNCGMSGMQWTLEGTGKTMWCVHSNGEEISFDEFEELFEEKYGYYPESRGDIIR